MSEALLLTFQSQLSVVMETVLKSAMFEITRLVEDSFLEEVGHRKQEVELLRRRLHLSESKLREKEDQWEQVRKSHCPDCGRPGDSSPREEIPPADTSRGLDAFSLGLRLIDQTSDQPSLASDIWSSRQKLDAFKHPASQSEEMSCASRRTEMMRQGSPAEFITTVSAAQPPLDVLHKLLGSSGVDSMSSSVCKSKSDQSETDLTFDKETDSRMLRSPLAVEANGSLEASSPNTSVKSELKLDFLPVKEEDEMIPVWESVSKDDGCDGEMADPSQEELRGACDQEEIQVETFPGLNSLDMPDATSFFTPYSVNTSVHRDNRAPHSLLCTAQLMLPSKPERSDSLVQPENGHSGPNGPEFSNHHRHNKKTVGHFSPSKCRAPAERFHHCTQCLRTFAKAGDLRAHMLLHKGKKPLNCSQCDQTFAYNFELKIHQQHHSGERPHICAHCGKAFARLSNFKQHQNIHTQEKIFSCSQCGTRFNRATNLRVHLRRHSHVGKTFSCLQCAESFLSFRQMKAHVVKIHQRGK